jgi:IS30 family transposase
MLINVANNYTESVISALIKPSRRLHSELYKSLTWGLRKELADHKRLALPSDVEVYFLRPPFPLAARF